MYRQPRNRCGGQHGASIRRQVKEYFHLAVREPEFKSNTCLFRTSALGTVTRVSPNVVSLRAEKMSIGSRYASPIWTKSPSW